MNEWITAMMFTTLSMPLTWWLPRPWSKQVNSTDESRKSLMTQMHTIYL
jgi:hypothetical protein